MFESTSQDDDGTYVTRTVCMNEDWKTNNHYSDRLNNARWLAGEFATNGQGKVKLGICLF